VGKCFGLTGMNKETSAACAHCGALVFGDTKKCPQCGRFPVKLHLCPKCKAVAGENAARCPQCGRMFNPAGDYL
jgi:RNA polymerase subunit RPABC4/transcription elongation factor Spt4